MVLGKLESGTISKAQQLIMMPNRVRLHTHTHTHTHTHIVHGGALSFSVHGRLKKDKIPVIPLH